jgi:hypothetical protein
MKILSKFGGAFRFIREKAWQVIRLIDNKGEKNPISLAECINLHDLVMTVPLFY